MILDDQRLKITLYCIFVIFLAAHLQISLLYTWSLIRELHAFHPDFASGEGHTHWRDKEITRSCLCGVKSSATGILDMKGRSLLVASSGNDQRWQHRQLYLNQTITMVKILAFLSATQKTILISVLCWFCEMSGVLLINLFSTWISKSRYYGLIVSPIPPSS